MGGGPVAGIHGTKAAVCSQGSGVQAGRAAWPQLSQRDSQWTLFPEPLLTSYAVDRGQKQRQQILFLLPASHMKEKHGVTLAAGVACAVLSGTAP